MSATLAALLKSYDEGRLLWEAKGWAMEDVADELTADPELANGLETRPKREHLTEIVEAGLRAVRGQPTNKDPRALAQELLAHFPTDELAHKLADALVNQAGGLGAVLDRLARLVTQHLPRALKVREAKLARYLAKRLDRLSAKRLAIAGAVGGLGGGLVACVVGLVFVVVHSHVASGSEVAHAPELAHVPVPASTTQPPMIVVATLAQGSAPLVFDPQALLGAIAGQLGEKVVDQAILSSPLPNQKVPVPG
jgi:hypothetical protein